MVLLLVVSGAQSPAILRAQDSTARRESAVAKLNTGQQIRISGEAMSRLVGKAGVAANDTLDFAQDDAVRRIPVPAIDTLWVRGGAGGTGAIVGAAVGTVLGLMALAAAHGTCDSDCGYSGLEVVGGILVGAAVVVPVGAIIGGRFQKWHRRYP